MTDELTQHIRDEFRRGTGLNPGHTPPEELVTQMATMLSTAWESVLKAGVGGALIMVTEGLKGLARESDEARTVHQVADEVLNKLADEVDASAEKTDADH